MAHKQTLIIEFDAADYPTLLEIFKKFQVKIKSKKQLLDIDNASVASVVNEPTSKYAKKPRPSADEIEQMIIKKALLDAKKIEMGELQTRSFNSVAELMIDLKANLKGDEDDF